MPRTVRTNAPPATATRLARGNVHVLAITHLAHRGVALHMDFADFAGGQLDQRVVALAVIEDDLLAGAAGDLTATAGNQLPRCEMEVPSGMALREQRIAHFRLDVLSGHDFIANAQPGRREDVGLLAVQVLEQRAMRQVRFGSYSIAFTSASMSRFLRLKSITPVSSACGHRRCARQVMRPLLVAATRATLDNDQRFLGLGIWSPSSNDGSALKRLVGVRGTESFECHDFVFCVRRVRSCRRPSRSPRPSSSPRTCGRREAGAFTLLLAGVIHWCLPRSPFF